MNTTNKMTLGDLRDSLIDTFSLEELDNLCFDLGIRYESLPGHTIDAKAKELVTYCQRRRRLSDLVLRLQELRPAVAWTVPAGTPLLAVAEPDEAMINGCRDMVTQIVERVLAIGERMSGKLLTIRAVPVFQLADLLPYEPGLKATLSIYRDGECGQLGQVAASIISEQLTAIQAEQNRLLAKRRSFGIQVPLALRRQIAQTQIQIGLLNLLSQLL